MESHLPCARTWSPRQPRRDKMANNISDSRTKTATIRSNVCIHLTRLHFAFSWAQQKYIGKRLQRNLGEENNGGHYLSKTDLAECIQRSLSSEVHQNNNNKIQRTPSAWSKLIYEYPVHNSLNSLPIKRTSHATCTWHWLNLINSSSR